MAEDRKKLIEVQDLVVRFGSRRHAFTAVDNVSFHIYQGETFGLVGESGSGKTTIGRAIIRIHPTAGGKILFDGKQINGRISKALDREVTAHPDDLSGPHVLPERTCQGGLYCQ